MLASLPDGFTYDLVILSTICMQGDSVFKSPGAVPADAIGDQMLEPYDHILVCHILIKENLYRTKMIIDMYCKQSYKTLLESLAAMFSTPNLIPRTRYMSCQDMNLSLHCWQAGQPILCFQEDESMEASSESEDVSVANAQV